MTSPDDVARAFQSMVPIPREQVRIYPVAAAQQVVNSMGVQQIVFSVDFGSGPQAVDCTIGAQTSGLSLAPSSWVGAQAILVYPSGQPIISDFLFVPQV